jgi:hypothetical protein
VSRYVVRPSADLDLEDQAYYYATEAGSELGHRFLIAAHETFAPWLQDREWGGASGLIFPALNRFVFFE